VTTSLTLKQRRLLESIERAEELIDGSVNWASTCQQRRESLVRKGLVVNLSMGGRHTQWSSYRLTEEGRAYLAARRKEENEKRVSEANIHPV